MNSYLSYLDVYCITVFHSYFLLGVLSQLSFSVDIDDLLCEIQQINVGCYMDGYFVGAVIYADDIAILGPNVYTRILAECKIHINQMKSWGRLIRA